MVPPPVVPPVPVLPPPLLELPPPPHAASETANVALRTVRPNPIILLPLLSALNPDDRPSSDHDGLIEETPSPPETASETRESEEAPSSEGPSPVEEASPSMEERETEKDEQEALEEKKEGTPIHG